MLEESLDLEHAQYFLSGITITPTDGPPSVWLKRLFIAMARNAASPIEAFRLPTDRTVSSARKLTSNVNRDGAGRPCSAIDSLPTGRSLRIAGCPAQHLRSACSRGIPASSSGGGCISRNPRGALRCPTVIETPRSTAQLLNPRWWLSLYQNIRSPGSGTSFFSGSGGRGAPSPRQEQRTAALASAPNWGLIPRRSPHN